MFDFSLTDINAENPSPLSLLYAFLVSFALSVLVAFTYERTSKHNSAPGHFQQAMILGSIMACIVTIVIGDSIGRGLGMLGIMAIIRFRTNIFQPRNIVFLFAALGGGIACGVFAFNVAIYGILFFCAVAAVLSFSPMNVHTRKISRLRLQFDDATQTGELRINEILKEHGIQANLVRKEMVYAGSSLRTTCTWEFTEPEPNSLRSLWETLAESIPPQSIRITQRDSEQII
ncbi:MAG: hypothetical protein JPMHGGIA_00150 [Saprospiraceae bacterium]|jgi:hypothetical protein|nr:hypothetical protein [Saprospiraceae bacterium]